MEGEGRRGKSCEGGGVGIEEIEMEGEGGQLVNILLVQNNFWRSTKMLIFPIFFSIAPHSVIALPTLG